MLAHTHTFDSAGHQIRSLLLPVLKRLTKERETHRRDTVTQHQGNKSDDMKEPENENEEREKSGTDTDCT